MNRRIFVAAALALLGVLAVAAPRSYAASPLPSHDDTAPACRAQGGVCTTNGQCCSKSCSINCTRGGKSVYCCM